MSGMSGKPTEQQPLPQPQPIKPSPMIKEIRG